jgi:HrpA-like RNA helicase
MYLQNLSMLNLTAMTGRTSQLDITSTTSNYTNASFTESHRKDLRIFENRAEIIQAVSESPVVIIKGQTGCGKVNKKFYAIRS